MSTGAIYKTDTGTYSPSPETVMLPAAGGTFIDGLSGVRVMRFTDENDGAGFGTIYSVWSTANCDNTKLWIYNAAKNSYHIGPLDPSNFVRVGGLKDVPPAPAKLYANYESACWARHDNDKLFILLDAKIYYFKPSTGTYVLVKDLTANFPAGTFFNQLYVSTDDNRFAGMLKNADGDHGFMVYDLAQDRVVINIQTTDVNGITMDKSGKFVLLVPYADSNEYVYNVDTGAKETLVSDRATGLPDFTVGHNDCGVDLCAGNDQW